MAFVLDRRQQKLLQTLWMQGPLSRWELHTLTGLTPNGVGTYAEAMVRAGLVREREPEPARLGRPRVPLAIDPSTRHLLGLALVPGRAEITRLALTGEVVGRPVTKDVSSPAALVKTAAALLERQVTSETLAIGVTSTGFLDPINKSILFSSALPGRGVESLKPVFDAAGDVPAVLGNDMHALAARWLLTHRAEQKQDVILVWFTDGRLGSAILIEGRPNRGCATGGNELGHTRFPGIETARCFCGQIGCLERIVSSDFLNRQDNNAKLSQSLSDRVGEFESAEADPALGHMLDLLAQSLSNAVNFIRSHRLVLASPYMRHAALVQALVTKTRALVLPELASRLKIDLWDQSSTGSAENAGWLALAELLYSGWDAAARTPRLAVARSING